MFMSAGSKGDKMVVNTSTLKRARNKSEQSEHHCIWGKGGVVGEKEKKTRQ